MVNNLLPDTKKGGFFNRLKLFFISITFKRDKLIQEHDDIANRENVENKGSSFMDNLKANTDVEKTCEEETLGFIVKKVEENPQVLDNLTIEQLENVNEYYNEKIQEVNNEINKIRRN